MHISKSMNWGLIVHSKQPQMAQTCENDVQSTKELSLIYGCPTDKQINNKLYNYLLYIIFKLIYIYNIVNPK